MPSSTDFLQTFADRRQCFSDLLELSRRQLGLVESDDYAQLLGLLGGKQRIIGRLEALGRARPQLWDEWRAARAELAPSEASRSVATTLPNGTTVSALLWTKPAAEKIVSGVIGPKGGTISIPAGVALVVPPGAVSKPTTFTITRLPGTIVAYDFEPHGTFNRPVEIHQPTLGTNLFKWTPSKISGAYFTSLNQHTGTATVTELEPTLVSADKAWIVFTTKHFSGYIFAGGEE